MSFIEFIVNARVVTEGKDIGSETFSMRVNLKDGDEGKVAAVTNIAETQGLIGGLGKQAALSATWKAATHLRESLPPPQFEGDKTDIPVIPPAE